MRRCIYVLAPPLFVLCAGILFLLFGFGLSALPNPSPRETLIANWAKRWYVSRAARGITSPKGLATTDLSAAQADFVNECAQCHGVNGRSPTDTGLSMYPRALDLSSPEVRHWSDAELFWIIRNGIRLSGMPGFGKVDSDGQIWQLVRYVRRLQSQPRQ